MRSSCLTLALFSLAGLATATRKAIPFKGQLGLPLSQHIDVLTPRDTCGGLSGYSSCDSDWCIPDDGTCCGYNDGSYCDDDHYCVTDGCCPTGEVCSGGSDGCDDDSQECGSSCIPEDAVCCNSGSLYCDKGQTCDGIFCLSGDDSDDDSDDDDDDDDNKSGKSGKIGKDDDDDDNAAGRFTTPALVVGLVAALPVVLL